MADPEFRTDGAVGSAAESFAALRIADSHAVARTTLRTRQHGGLEILARQASGGQASMQDIIALARVAADSPVLPSGRWSTHALHRLGHTLAGFAMDDSERRDALSVLDVTRRLRDRDKKQPLNADIELHLALVLGDLDHVRAGLDLPMPPGQKWALTCDLLNPAITHQGQVGPESTEWWRAFNSLLRDKGVSPVSVTSGPGTPFDRLTCQKPQPHKPRANDPLVSIVMSVFKPAASFHTALNSLTSQTWTNLQILVVDDGNRKADAAVIREACARDSRIEYIRQTPNGGSYRARNRALELATGDYVGFQDADDWSHPERIARQVTELERDRSLVANQSMIARTHRDLTITKFGRVPYIVSAASLIFRREPVLEKLGYYDTVRKAADREFIARMGVVFGDFAIRILDQPLGICQLTAGSLSRDDFGLGWKHSSRTAYRGAFNEWHARITAEQSSARLELEAPTRVFVAPRKFLSTSNSDIEVDVHIVGDLRHGAPGASGLLAEAQALASAGLQIAVTSFEPLTAARVRRSDLHPGFWRAALADEILVAPWDAPVQSRLLLVRDPSAFMWNPPPIGANPAAVVTTAANIVFDPLGGHAVFDPAHVAATVRRDLDKDLTWLPEDEQTAIALRAAGVSGVLAPRRLQVTQSTVTLPRPIIEQPVLGLHHNSFDGIFRSFPVATIAESLGNEGHDVRIYGDASSPLSFDSASVSENEFFDQIDVFIAPSSHLWGAIAVRSALVALSRGCIVIAAPDIAAHLNDLAVVMDGRPLATIVKELTDNPAQLLARKTAGREWCATRTSASEYAAAVSDLMKASLTHA